MKQELRKSIAFTLVLALCFALMSAFVTIEAQAASKTHLAKTSITMTTGAKYQQKLLTASNKTISSSKVEWSSNNSKVAKVSKTGKVTAVKQGTTTIKAKYKGKTFSFKVKVRDCQLYYIPGTTCVVGGKMQMYLSGAGGRIDTSKASWKSSNENVLTVNSKGVVTGVGTGTAKVYATYLNKKYSCEISVEWGNIENVSIEIPYAFDKGVVHFKYTTNYPEGVKVEIGKGSELVKVFHENQGSGNNRYASICCYPNATGQVQLKVFTVSEPDAYFLYELNFKNGEFVGENNSSGGSQESVSDVFLQQIIDRTIQNLKNGLYDPNSLEIYDTTIEWIEPNTYLCVKIDYGAKNGFGGMGRDFYRVYWKKMDDVNWKGSIDPYFLQ